MKKFNDKDFLLETETAKDLYHNHAAKMPIIDYHCHLIPQMVAENKKFESIAHGRPLQVARYAFKRY